MASTINASTSPAAIVQTADGTANLSLQSNGTTIAAITSTGLAVTGALTTNGVTGSPYTMKNRIINGAMVIDQRNAGASVTPTTTGYTLDRFNAEVSQSSKFSVQQNAGSVTPPVGFANYLGVTSLSAYTLLAGDYFDINQPIEGFNTNDLAYGTASAKTCTMSCWVYSSLTGTFGGRIYNNTANKSYVFTYSIPTANTWTFITITFAGDTASALSNSNAATLYVQFALGVGSTYSTASTNSWIAGNYLSATGATSVVSTSGAKWYVTGVQLEVGSSATSFEWRPYPFELSMCYRYYYQETPTEYYYPFACYVSTIGVAGGKWPVTMRAMPTMAVTAASYVKNIPNSPYQTAITSITTDPTIIGFGVYGTVSGMSAGQCYNSGFTLTASAEL